MVALRVASRLGRAPGRSRRAPRRCGLRRTAVDPGEQERRRPRTTRHRPGTRCRARRPSRRSRRGPRRRRASCPRASRSRRSRSAGPPAPRRSGSMPRTPGRTTAANTDKAASRTYASQRLLRPDGEERDAERRSGDVARDHETAPIEAVGEPPRPRRREEDRQLLRHDQDAHREGLARHLEHQAAERDEQEPVAAERDHRREEQAAEVAVPPSRETAARAPVARSRSARSAMACKTTGRPRVGRETRMLEPITWFRQAALRWRDAERTIYVDPWGTPADAPPADMILITHAHHDHFQPEEIARLSTASHQTRRAARRCEGADRRRHAGRSGRVARGGRPSVHDGARLQRGGAPAPVAPEGEPMGRLHRRAGGWDLLPRRRYGPRAGARRRQGRRRVPPDRRGPYTMGAEEAAGLAKVDPAADRGADALRVRGGVARATASGSATSRRPFGSSC